MIGVYKEKKQAVRVTCPPKMGPDNELELGLKFGNGRQG
jgi:hypothetical protein